MDRHNAANNAFPPVHANAAKTDPTLEAAKDKVTELGGVSLTPGGQNIN
jgi:hypothetical protein